MKNFRKAFSLIEVLLVALIVGLVAAVFIPASIKIRDIAKEQVVKDNISTIISAGQKYNSEKTMKSVDYKTLVESKYLPALKSVFGESYDKVLIDSAGGSIKLDTPDGRAFERDY